AIRIGHLHRNYVLFTSHRDHLVTHTFPTRRSSDLCGEDTARCRFWFRSGVTATLEASLANAVPTSYECVRLVGEASSVADTPLRSEEHTSELQSRVDLVCRLLLEKKIYMAIGQYKF